MITYITSNSLRISKHRCNRNTQLAGGSPVSDGTDYAPLEKRLRNSLVRTVHFDIRQARKRC